MVWIEKTDRVVCSLCGNAYYGLVVPDKCFCETPKGRYPRENDRRRIGY